MGAILSITVKVMPESADEDLREIERQGLHNLSEVGAKNISFEEKPIAFGLKALFFKFAWPEEKDSDVYESVLAKIKGVGSVQTEEYRRAFG